MQKFRELLYSKLQAWHLLAAVYGFIIVVGLIYRLIN